MAYYDYYYYGFRPYVSVAARRAQAARELAKLRKNGRAMSPVAIEGRKIAQNVLGRSVVRQPRTLQRLRESAAARAGPTCATDRWSICRSGRARHGARQRLGDVQRAGDGRPGAAGPMERHLQGLLGRYRLARRASAGTLLEGRHDASLRGEDRAVSVAEGHSSSRAAARTGRRCASTWRRCCTASARGWIVSRSCYSRSARSINRT